MIYYKQSNPASAVAISLIDLSAVLKGIFICRAKEKGSAALVCFLILACLMQIIMSFQNTFAKFTINRIHICWNGLDPIFLDCHIRKNISAYMAVFFYIII